MKNATFLYIFLALLFITACDTQPQTPQIEKNTGIEPVEKTGSSIAVAVKLNAVSEKARPALNLFIDNILSEHIKSANILIKDTLAAVETSSALFNRLSQKRRGSSINVSGEFLTDKNTDENTDFLKSIDGLQIEVNRRFN